MFRSAAGSRARLAPQAAGEPAGPAGATGRRAASRSDDGLVDDDDARADDTAGPADAREVPAHVRSSEVDDVVVQFGGVTAVDHASFAADAGRITGLIGPNGAGKTTCFNVITGLQKPTRGRVRFDGRNVTRTPVHRRAQARHGPHLPAAGGVRLADRPRERPGRPRHPRAASLGPGPAGRADVDGLLERVGIAAYADERADSIPTGTARLLELARCLAGDPKLLLLDEPSSGLDEAETDAFGELLARAGRRGPRRSLMVEHDMDLVMAVCDDDPRARLRRGDRLGHARRGPRRPARPAGLPRLLRRARATATLTDLPAVEPPSRSRRSSR